MSRLTKKVDEKWNYELDYTCLGHNDRREKHTALGDLQFVNKLGKIEDCEEQLGIEVLTLLKALFDSIYCVDEWDGGVYIESIREMGNYGEDGWGFVTWEDHGEFLFKDYGKTWALTVEELTGTNKDVQNLIDRTFQYGENNGLGSFINEDKELIVIPKINAYFRLEDVETELDFKCKVLNWLSFYASPNHWSKRWSNEIIDYTNFILHTDFSKEDFETIYNHLGNGINNDLTIKFIRSNYDMKVLEEDE